MANTGSNWKGNWKETCCYVGLDNQSGGPECGFFVLFFVPTWTRWNLFLSHLCSPGSHQDVLPTLFSQPTETDCSVPTQAFKGLWGWCHPVGSQKGKSPSLLHLHAHPQVLLSTCCLCPVLCMLNEESLATGQSWTCLCGTIILQTRLYADPHYGSQSSEATQAPSQWNCFGCFLSLH